MEKYTAAAVLALSAFGAAAPLEDRSLSAAVCLVVNPVVQILHAYPSASPFCSSFLAIPTITTTKTVSATASFTSPTTTTVPTTVSTFTSTADPVTVYSTSETTVTTCIPSAVNKRDVFARAQTSTSSASSSKITGSLSGSCAGCPNALKGIACNAISTACGCLSIPTPTSTVTYTQTLSTTAFPTTTALSSVIATVTVTDTTTIPTVSTSTVNYCPTPVSCNNEGIHWAIYPNAEYNGDRLYTSFDPTVIKSQTPEYQSTASVAGGLDVSAVGQISIYGSTQTFESDYFTLNHVGYIFAQVSGTYTFTVSNADDIALLWLGANAYSGWTRPNANAVAIVGGASTESASATFDLVAEQYLPFRIVFGQAQGAVKFFFTISAPDGTVVLDSNTQDSKFLVQYSCDGVAAPAFPTFGSES